MIKLTKYELSITPDYVPDWTLVDAMRELFQNALDQETTVPDNKMFFEYHDDIESFHIGNKLSVLEPKSLLLGSTTKSDDDNTIGKFGEGYKIAALVLTRLGKKLTFFNYGAREVWKFRFSKSRKYGSEILVVEVDKKFPWKAVPNNNLTIVVEGITEDEYYSIGEHNLHMQEAYAHWKTPKGKILLDEDLKGKMFVNGLYVCTNDEFHCGYDFTPSALTLDRDRKLVGDFDLSWATSKIWSDFQDDAEATDWDFDTIDKAIQLLELGAPDVKYLKQVNYFDEGPRYSAISTHSYRNFKHDYGDNAVPVTTHDELEAVPDTHKPVLVKEAYKEVIVSSPEYTPPPDEVKQTLRDEVEDWINAWGEGLSNEALVALRAIAEEFDK